MWLWECGRTETGARHSRSFAAANTAVQLLFRYQVLGKTNSCYAKCKTSPKRSALGLAAGGVEHLRRVFRVRRAFVTSTTDDTTGSGAPLRITGAALPTFGMWMGLERLQAMTQLLSDH